MMEWTQYCKLNSDDAKKIKYVLWMIEQDSINLTPSQLAEAREMAGLTQAQAARILNVPVDAIEGIENGRGWERLDRGLATLVNQAYGINWKPEDGA